MRHFLTLPDLSPDELQGLIRRAIDLKARHRAGEMHQPLRGKILGMVFEKSSTRTRVSFEAGMAQLGGHALFLSPRDTQLGRGEPIEDTARVLSRMVDIIMIRTYEHEKIERFAEHSQVPVINALTDKCHPCQLLADMQTYIEHRGDIRGRTVAWIGDGNNMCNSYIGAAKQFDFRLKIAAPEGYAPDPAIVACGAGHVEVYTDPAAAARGADLVVTDVWASMGQEDEIEERNGVFAAYQVDEAMMARAKPGACFLHCLPAHRGWEVTQEVMDGPQSIVYDNAENRLHVQKAIMALLMSQPRNGQ